MSKLESRHSKEIAQNPKAAVAVVIHEDKPGEEYVIGLAAEGTAKLISKEVSGDPHKIYRFTPTSIVLFDKKNFPDQPRQELKLS